MSDDEFRQAAETLKILPYTTKGGLIRAAERMKDLADAVGWSLAPKSTGEPMTYDLSEGAPYFQPGADPDGGGAGKIEAPMPAVIGAAELSMLLRDQAFARDYVVLHDAERGVHDGNPGGTPDPGGPTAHGISQVYYGHMFPAWPPTQAQARVFWRGKWDTWRLYDRIRHEPLRAQVFLLAANADLPVAITAIQAAIRAQGIPVGVDVGGGIWGPQMERAMQRIDHGALLVPFKAAAIMFYHTRPRFRERRSTWLRRLDPVES